MFRCIVVFVVLCTCVSAHAANLSGLVMDGSNGVPLEGATITLKDAGLSVTTDAEGHYSFDGAITDEITFSKAGYDSVSRSIASTGGTENVVLTLAGKVTYVCTTADVKGRWQIARPCMTLKPRHRISLT